MSGNPYSFEALGFTLPQLFKRRRVGGTEGVAAAKAELSKAVDERSANLMLTFAESLAPE